MTLSRINAERERVKASLMSAGAKALRLHWLDKAEEKLWRSKKQEAERRLQEIREKREAERDERERRKGAERMRRQLHRSLSRYEMPEAP